MGFTVTGQDADALYQAMQQRLCEFLPSGGVVSEVRMDASPQVVSATGEVVSWAAEVTAVWRIA